MPREDRFHADDRAGDQRSAFQRDRDRVLYTSSLRRLAGITQVAGASEGGVLHNRLTHTLEVAQVARRLAEWLVREQTDLAGDLGGLSPDVAETAALAHDLGHPPFGHVGEDALDDCCSDWGLQDGFEGNAQSFRIVTKTTIRHTRFRGLNLTRASLNAILKYPWFRQGDAGNDEKFGAYKSEADHFEFARAEQGEANAGVKSVEAEVMDYADDIAYAVHDIEDFYRAGLIPLHRVLFDEGGELQKFLDGVYERWSLEGEVDKLDIWEELTDAFRHIIEIAEVYPLQESFTGSRLQRAALKSFTSLLIGRYIVGMELTSPETGQRCVSIDPLYERELTMLKQLTWHYVITNPSLAAQQHGQRKVLKYLFEVWRTEMDKDNPAVLPFSARERWGQEKRKVEAGTISPEQFTEEKTRIVLDTICSMTEPQALAMFHRLSGNDPGSLLDVIVP